MNEKSNEKSDYSKLSGLEGGPNDIVYQDDESHSLAAKAPTIIQQEDGCRLERNTSFVSDIEEILLLVLKEGDQKIARELVGLLNDISFDITVLGGTAKTLQDAKMSFQKEQV